MNKELYQIMRKTYDELIDFVLQDNFKKLVEELYAQPLDKRPEFVQNEILTINPVRNINIPKDILIQRSSFGDRRPTLFVVKKYLPKDMQYAWENVNITFDQEYDDKDVPREPDLSWRKPLPFEIQAAFTALGLSEEDIAELKT